MTYLKNTLNVSISLSRMVESLCWLLTFRHISSRRHWGTGRHGFPIRVEWCGMVSAQDLKSTSLVCFCSCPQTPRLSVLPYLASPGCSRQESIISSISKRPHAMHRTGSACLRSWLTGMGPKGSWSSYSTYLSHLLLPHPPKEREEKKTTKLS